MSDGDSTSLPVWSRCQGAGAAEASALRHALFWLMTANAVGLGLACLLLVPEWNELAGPLTYGRWMPVHMNLHLYGWTSLPLVAWLFRMYRVDQTPARAYGRSVVWVWSMALAVGSISWLAGGSSGKLFLDWRGYARILLTAAMLVLWGLLAWAWVAQHRRGGGAPQADARTRRGSAAAICQGLGLLVLLLVPFVWFWAASPAVYPAVNPDSGGPTGASLLGSTLIVVLLVLLLPPTLGKPAIRGRWRVGLAWGLFATEMVFYGVLNRSHASHHDLAQLLGLGSLMPWLVVLPVYYQGFDWPKPSRQWLGGFLAWMSLLILTGWLSFFPGLLERLKFTSGLVAHAHLAMAGFVTCFNAFVLCLLSEGRPAERALSGRAPFWMWQIGTLVFLLVMWLSGWIEGAKPSFTIVPSGGKTLLYGIRAGCGLAMLAASVVWWRAAWRAGERAGEWSEPTNVKGSAERLKERRPLNLVDQLAMRAGIGHGTAGHPRESITSPVEEAHR